MKKTVIICMALAAVIASCNKENIQPIEKGTNTITASLELNQNAQTKTSLGTNNTVLWSANDALSLFDSEGINHEYTISNGVGETSATFTGDECTPAYALYPYSENATISGSSVTFTLPSDQTYVAGSFANNANVAVAEASSLNNISFKNVCGVLCLQIKGNYRVSRIVLTSKNASDYLCGKFRADASSATPAINYVSNGSTSITLNCNGAQLDPTTAMPFYIVVPAGALASGFTATIYDDADDIINEVVQTSKTQTVTRNCIRKMASKTVSHLSGVSGVNELTYIAGASSSLAVIDAKYKPTQDTKVRTRVFLYNARTAFGTWAPPKYFARLSGNSEQGLYQFGFGNNMVSLSYRKVKQFETFVVSSSGLYLSDVCKKSSVYSDTSFVCSNMGIMGAIGKTTGAVEKYDCMGSSDKMTYLQIWQKSSSEYVLQKYFVPCITTVALNNVEGVSVPIGTVGMYDIVAGALYTCWTGTSGTFNAGPVLE